MNRPTILFILYVFLIQNSCAQENSLGDTLGAFNAGVLTSTPDRSLSGVEYVDGHYWVTGADPDDGYNHKLYKINAIDQILVQTFEYGLEFAGWSDLAYDGTFLYVADIDTIRQINIETGQKTGVKINAPEYYINGLAYDPESDHFWVSSDGNLIYEIDREGNVEKSISFINDLPAAGLAWDTWTEGGPFLWVWSMKYMPNDVRPKAFQINPATGLLTGFEFEGVIMHPNYPNGADYAMGATISDEIIDGKISFVGLHGSSYETSNDQLDWIVNYDLDPDNTGIPGPVISVNPGFIENDLYPGDSAEVVILIENLSNQFQLNWQANLEYPGLNNPGQAGDTLTSFDASLLTPDTTTNLRGIAYIGDYIYVSSGLNFNDQLQLYQFEKNGSALLGVDTLYSVFNGWSAITSDDQYIYGVQQYMIQVFDPVNNTIVDTYSRPNFSPSAIAYDAQMEHFYLGNGNGAVMITNKQGDELNFYVIPFEIEGLSWDNVSPGGPFLWVYYLSESGLSSAVRLDPESGSETGAGFTGLNLSGDENDPDQARDIIVTKDWQENKLVMLALHASNDSANDGQDKVVVYDLDVTPAPGWIDLIGSSYGTVDPLTTDTLIVRLDAIMEDTLMIAQLAVSSNDVLTPIVNVPVNFMMLPAIQTGIDQASEQNESSFIKVFPNPAQHKVSIEIDKIEENLKFYCFDNEGRLLLKMDIEQEKKSIDLNVSEWPGGIYTLLINGQKTYQVEHLIVK